MRELVPHSLHKGKICGKITDSPRQKYSKASYTATKFKLCGHDGKPALDTGRCPSLYSKGPINEHWGHRFSEGHQRHTPTWWSIVEAVKPFYRICSSGYNWYNTFTKHPTMSLELTAIPTDRELFITFNQSCSAMLGLLVDETIVCGYETISKLANKSVWKLR